MEAELNEMTLSKLDKYRSKFENLETPFFFYDLGILEETLKAVQESSSKYGYHVHYAMKANTKDVLLKKVLDYGFGADCVSGNEVKKAIETGFKAEQIAFAGVGKTDKEITYALNQDIFSFNCESFQEIEIINQIASNLNKKARIALRINPNVNANTHKYITTGLEENKFGINTWELSAVMDLVNSMKNIELTGLHFHIGSQINDLQAFRDLCVRVNEIGKWFSDRRITIEHLNMGGGLGVDYKEPDTNTIPDFKSYFELFNRFLEVAPEQKVHFELGRSIIAQCGSLISRVLFIKKGTQTNFAILDAGMTDLIRPALYQAYHKIENLSSASEEVLKYDVVGPICESSDCFGKAVVMPETSRGDLIAIRTAGAYGQVMASSYNLREFAPEYYSE
jgi:diaminopimelate decarboxylase